MCIGEFQQSHPAHALAFVRPEVELAMIGGCRKIGQIERDGGTVKIDLAANAPEARADDQKPFSRMTSFPAARRRWARRHCNCSTRARPPSS